MNEENRKDATIGFNPIVEIETVTKEEWELNWNKLHIEEPEMRQKKRRMERDWEKFNERSDMARR